MSGRVEKSHRKSYRIVIVEMFIWKFNKIKENAAR